MQGGREFHRRFLFLGRRLRTHATGPRGGAGCSRLSIVRDGGGGRRRTTPCSLMTPPPHHHTHQLEPERRASTIPDDRGCRLHQWLHLQLHHPAPSIHPLMMMMMDGCASSLWCAGVCGDSRGLRLRRAPSPLTGSPGCDHRGDVTIDYICYKATSCYNTATTPLTTPTGPDNTD